MYGDDKSDNAITITAERDHRDEFVDNRRYSCHPAAKVTTTFHPRYGFAAVKAISAAYEDVMRQFGYEVEIKCTEIKADDKGAVQWR